MQQLTNAHEAVLAMPFGLETDFFSSCHRIKGCLISVTVAYTLALPACKCDSKLSAILKSRRG